MSPSFSVRKKILSWPVAAEKGRGSVPSGEDRHQKYHLQGEIRHQKYVYEVRKSSNRFIFNSWNLEGGVSMNLFIAVEAHEEMVMALFDGPDLSLF